MANTNKKKMSRHNFSHSDNRISQAATHFSCQQTPSIFFMKFHISKFQFLNNHTIYLLISLAQLTKSK